MSGNKTTPGPASATGFLASIEDAQQRADCLALLAMMETLTGEPAVMWGAAIVGFGRYHYRYDSGREGDGAVTAFSPRRTGISVYLTAAGPDQAALLARLGRHTMGKSCLTLRRLSDVDPAVLEALIADSVAEVRRRYP